MLISRNLILQGFLKSGSKSCKPEVTFAIHLALGISIDYLVGNEETPAYTAKNLTEYQAELLDELISEFHSPTNRSPQLSEQQLQILQKLIAIFTDVG